jgi:hypothetical protein
VKDNALKILAFLTAGVVAIATPTISSATTFSVPSYVERVGATQANLLTVESVGDFLWSASNSTPKKVVKISKSTGLVDATYNLQAGATGSIFKSSVDENYLWLSHNTSGISRINLADGTSSYFTSGIGPSKDVVSDGTYAWVTSQASDEVYKLEVETGAVVSPAISLNNPLNIDTDGTHVYVTHDDGQSLAKLDRASGAVIFHSKPTGISSGASTDVKVLGNSVFVSANGGTRVYELSAETGDSVSEITNSGYVGALVVYGGMLWIMNGGATTSYQFDLQVRTSDAPTLVGSFLHGGTSGKANAVYDGVHLWAADLNGVVSKYSAQSYGLAGPDAGASPGYTPVTAVIDVNPTNITVANEIITILGANLNTVTEVYIGGIRVQIFFQSGNRLQVRAPRGLSGLVDLELKSSLNDVLMTKKLNFGGVAETGAKRKTLVVGGFAPNSQKLTAAMKRKINRWLERNAEFETLTCTGFTSLPRLTSDVRLSTRRGLSACNFAEDQRSGLTTSVSQGIEDPRPGSSVRRVRLVLTN